MDRHAVIDPLIQEIPQGKNVVLKLLTKGQCHTITLERFRDYTPNHRIDPVGVPGSQEFPGLPGKIMLCNYIAPRGIINIVVDVSNNIGHPYNVRLPGQRPVGTILPDHNSAPTL
ncbi:MAG: hypothetical protein A4E63_03143 [Syntrophorhabdus sp. PtaU1.Bin050]|nr:MAG: hypothetical protein A4E63_03143 [Syntrophorhabdus sp. PtaU1.Bin050]